MMELRQLRHFVTVLEEGGFTRAAARLHLTQPPLSVSIRKLEAELGVALLERTRAGVRPTAAGEAFAREARLALDQAERAAAAARATAAGTEVPLRVAFFIPVSNLVLAPALRLLGRRAPRAQLELVTTNLLEGARRLRDGQVDVHLGLRTEPDGAELQSEILFRTRLMAFFPENHRFARRRSVSARALRGEPLIQPPPAGGPTGGDVAWDYLRRAGGFVPNVVRREADLPALMTLVAAGAGASVAFSLLTRPAFDGVAAVPLQGEVPTLDAVLQWRAGRRGAALDAFAAAVREAASRL